MGVAGEVGQKPDVKPRGSNIKPNGKPAREQWSPRIWPEEKRVWEKKRAQDARALRRIQEEALEEILLLDIDVEFDKLQVSVASIVVGALSALIEVQVRQCHTSCLRCWLEVSSSLPSWTRGVALSDF